MMGDEDREVVVTHQITGAPEAMVWTLDSSVVEAVEDFEMRSALT